MSKAFTRESDESAATDLPVRESSLPAGARNYITVRGAERLRAELDRLVADERPAAARAIAVPATTGDDPRHRLALIDRRIAELRASLAQAEPVDPMQQDPARVLFGATVTLEDAHGRAQDYRIVGVDEADAERRWISWISPRARALLGLAVGEAALIRTPRGEEELTVRSVRYDP